MRETIRTLSKSILKIGFILSALTGNLSGCNPSGETELDPDLSNPDAIQVIYSQIKQPFINADLQNYLSGPYTTTKKNNIIFIFIDALRGDFITNDLAPNLAQFLQSNQAAPGVSASTVTHSSSFSIFYGLNSYLKDKILSNYWGSGSPFLNILKRVGYRESVFGSPWQYCIDGTKFFTSPKELRESAESNLQLLYGLRSKNLLDFCYENGQGPGKPQLFPSVFIKQTDQNGSIFGHQAYLDYKVSRDFLDDIKARSDKNFYMLYLFSTHLPYAWPDRGPLASKWNGSKILQPNIPWSPGESLFKENANENAKINSYKNAVAWVDYIFKMVTDELKKIGKYDDSIIVLFADHGEFLHDKNPSYMSASDRVGHCCIPYPENTRIPIVYKFPVQKNGPVSIKKSKETLATHVDIAPTILDYLEYSDISGVKNFFQGSSVLQHDRKCAVSFSPTGKLGPRTFSLSIGDKIYYLLLNNRNSLKSDGFYFLEEYQNKTLTLKFDKSNNDHLKIVSDLMSDKNFLECVNEIFIKPSN